MPVVWGEKLWFGEYRRRTHVLCLIAEWGTKCLAVFVLFFVFVEESGHWAMETAMAAFWEGRLFALFCSSPSPALATAPQLFHTPPPRHPSLSTLGAQ